MVMASGMAPPVQPVPAAQRALPDGTLLDEYEIEGVLAQCSIAVAYRAYDRVLKMHVAIKEYLPDALALRSADGDVVLRDGAHAQSFERGRQAFVDEARMLAHCEHPALQHTLRMLHQHGTVYRVMHSCSGQTLDERRRTLIEAPSAASVRALLDSLLGALAELHRKGWVHAAISPSNILMRADDRPLLLDTGAVQAALISGRTRSMMAALEPCFAPIELREPSPDMPTGPWTDLYSLAATLHAYVGGGPSAALTDESPARRFEPFGALWQRLHGDRPGAAQEWSWLNALDACLAEPAQDRLQSVAQLRALLEGQDASSQLLTLAAPSRWMAVCNEMVEAAGPRPLVVVAAQAKDYAGLEQSLPFVAARTHEVVAVSYARAGPSLQAPPRRRRGLWAGGAALLLLLLMVAVAHVEWAGDRSVSSGTPDPRLAGGMANALAQPAPVPAAIMTSDPAPAGAGSDGHGGAVIGAELAPPPGTDVTPADVATSDAGPAPPPGSPRRQCGARSGYALYQCMQAQCAKRSWTQHAQCQRLRRDQSLG